MGLSQITAGIYSSRKKKLALEEFHHIGLQKTHCKDKLVTDSAAGATAMARGIKANANTFGTTKKEKAPRSILEELESAGWSTGIAVTASITHATPAAFVTYQLFRNHHEQIAADFLLTEVDYLVGGGRNYFKDRHVDDRNLLVELEKKGYTIGNIEEESIEAISLNNVSKLAYFTADDQPKTRKAGRTYLVPAVKRGLKFLSNLTPDKGFFFLIEASQIDWGGHSNLEEIVIDELLELDDTVAEALDFAKKDGNTLVLVTADHETGGFSITDEDEKGKPVISFVSKKHTAAMVPVFAYGPQSEIFQGVYDNTEIHTKMKKAMQLPTTEHK